MPGKRKFLVFRQNYSDCGKSIVIVYVMDNILIYGPTLKVENGGRGGHFKMAAV